MEEIFRIMGYGQRQVLEEEPVLGGLTRPLKVKYTSQEGVVIETWTYPPNTAMEKWWGAIQSVSYELIDPEDDSKL